MAPSASNTLVDALYRQLPFTLTQAQQRVVGEISHDLQQAVPMARLLQGDVGSGKTVVAALAAAQAIAAGYQCALMAPTEILAEQHWQKLQAWFAPLGVKMAWLAGALSKSEKQTVVSGLAAGSLQLVVGTHALIQETVQFANLGLAIIDEQHRFGVAQRRQLQQARQHLGDGTLVHQLMMSATPIPRTLAMTFFADLDNSVIDELPPGRQPIKTKLVEQTRRDEVLASIRQAVTQGQQVYWVCPLIEESEALQLQTAVDTHAELSAALPELTVGLLHGRMKAEEKAAVMAAFAAGDLAVLVATTVIEVGVDVPNASLMVIEHAERFGLAQLHQLRGRVGRGQAASVCVLLYAGPLGQQAKARLKTMYESQDGFYIAQQDLEIRGPGEFLGVRQAGLPMLRYADLSEDTGLLELARQVATTIRSDYPEMIEAHLDRWLPNRATLFRT
jgi:ATP-dependent DNA helicase RecG